MQGFDQIRPDLVSLVVLFSLRVTAVTARTARGRAVVAVVAFHQEMSHQGVIEGGEDCCASIDLNKRIKARTIIIEINRRF